MRCLPALTLSGGDETLLFEIDGCRTGLTLRVEQLNRQLVSALPPRALDLLEIAALVYGVDAAVSRGGSADQQMGAKWHRRFVLDVPVRDLTFWCREDLIQCLAKTLMFLTGDHFAFSFHRKEQTEAEQTRFFRFDKASAWQASRVLMFSGGLDSFAGALEEIAEQGHRVALVSHVSASKLAPVQRELQNVLAKKFGQKYCAHVPVQVRMVGRGLKEGTHRSRSFLFAALGAITAQAHGLDRVSFHENGVVSLNLPTVGNVVGTRATRTTHPQTLVRFAELLGKVLEDGMRVDNPYFWRTKAEVVQTIARLDMADQIALTRSCADVHNQTKQHPHCGRCSQCIDRAFACRAAGLQHFDPPEAYKVDLFEDAREDVRDREMALSYVRNAQAFEQMTEADLERAFPAVLDAVGYLDRPPDNELSMISALLRRHGSAVSGVMRDVFNKRAATDFPDGSLPRLYGDTQRAILFPAIDASSGPQLAETENPIEIQIDEEREIVDLYGIVEFRKGATARLLIALAKIWLEGAGQGLKPLDFPLYPAGKLATDLGYDSDESVRQAVNRARDQLKKKLTSAGHDLFRAAQLIENIPWHGYRLAPDLVVVRRRSTE